MKKLILLLTLFLTACTDPAGAQKAIEAAGLEPQQVGGYSFFGCGKDDTFATKFSAKNQNGKIVEGVVCSGIFKGATVRFF